MKRVNYTGKRYGRLVVLSREDRIENNRTNCFLYCKCDCGNEKEIRYSGLISGQTQSCGCLQKEKLSKRSRKSKGHAATHSIWGYYKRNAKLREFDWKLTKDQFVNLIFKPCHYCCTEKSMFTKMKYGDECYYNGIDRINSNIGYILDNCVPCCNICNRAKGTLTVNEFFKWLKLFEGRLK